MSSVGTHTIGAGGSCVDCGRGSEDMGGNPCHTNPSPTHDSEDWMDKILREIYDRLATEDTGIGDDYFIEDTDYKKRILAHYARPTKAQLELAAKVATLEQKIYMMESTYLKPEDVERAVNTAEDAVIEKAHKPCECGSDHFATPVRSVTGVVTTYCQFSRIQLSKLNREEKKDAKT